MMSPMSNKGFVGAAVVIGAGAGPCAVGAAVVVVVGAAVVVVFGAADG